MRVIFLRVVSLSDSSSSLELLFDMSFSMFCPLGSSGNFGDGVALEAGAVHCGDSGNANPIVRGRVCDNWIGNTLIASKSMDSVIELGENGIASASVSSNPVRLAMEISSSLENHSESITLSESK